MSVFLSHTMPCAVSSLLRFLSSGTLSLLRKSPLPWILALLVLPLFAHASELFQTIQTGSFVKEAGAQKHYELIIQKLQENELDSLRIEKVGKFYTVRLGKFGGYAQADNLLQIIKPKISTAIIVEASLKNAGKIVNRHRAHDRLLKISIPYPCATPRNLSGKAKIRKHCLYWRPLLRNLPVPGRCF